MNAISASEDGKVLFKSHASEHVKISVLICTRNRAEGLASCLKAIAIAQQNALGLSEVVIVDNNSTDRTADVLQTWAKDKGFPVTIVRAMRPGLAAARNVGLSVVRGDVIAMTDDDCCVAPDYLLEVDRAFPNPTESHVIGGRIDLGDPTDLPITIKPIDQPETFVGSRMPSGFIMGANLMITASTLQRIGFFDERFGAGARFISAEDTDFLVRALIAKIPISYTPNVKVAHFHGRKELADAQSLYVGYSFGDGAIFAKYLLSQPFVLRSFAGILKRITYEIFRPANDQIMGKRKSFWRLKQQIRGFAFYIRHR